MVRKQVYEMIYEVKLKEAMEKYLPGPDQGGRHREPADRRVKLANEEQDPDYRVDGDVKLMGNKDDGGARRPAPAGPPGAASGTSKMPPPVALSPEAATAVPPAQARRQPGTGRAVRRRQSVIDAAIDD